MAKEPTMAVPGSLTDFIKALRELIGATKDIAELVKKGASLFDGRRARKAAAGLYALSFTPEGSKRHLERIAAGCGTREDLQAISEQMANSAGEVESSILTLRRYSSQLREQGMKAAQKLDDIIFGPSGKQAIRMLLQAIANEGSNNNPNQSYIRSTSQRALYLIHQLNEDLVILHDLILPPRRET